MVAFYHKFIYLNSPIPIRTYHMFQYQYTYAYFVCMFKVLTTTVIIATT